MNSRILMGSLISFAYSHGIGRLPSRLIRRIFLRGWLGGMGNGTNVQMNCRFLNGRKVHLGNRNVINFGSLFDGRKFHIYTGDDVSIGPEAAILTLGHDPQSPEFADRGGDVVIGNHVWIGYRALILPGIRIGDGAVIGAGSIVTKDVEPFTIVAGNPARKIGNRCKDLSYELRYQPFLV